MDMTPEALVERVQVNIPFPFLINGYLSRFLDRGLNPEIGLDAWSLGTYPPRTFRRIARAFTHAGRRLTIHGPFQDLAPGALDDMILAASRRRLRQAWRWLPVFRPAAVVCHLAYEDRHYHWDQETWLSRAAATFRELGVQARKYGVRVSLENVYEQDPELVQAALQRIGLDNVQLCLDVGHLNAFGGGDFESWLKILWPFIRHLHLHDNQGTRDDHQALGTGTIPFSFILDFLAAKDRQPLITLEPHQEGSLEPSLQYLADIWPWE
ncbi:MAG: sugar phosphate isomerase/epimerase family protein [Thermodesulfobacteriota bacterium]